MADDAASSKQRPTPDHPRWRQGYDAVEAAVAPQIDKLVGADQFAQGMGALLALRREVEERMTRTSRRVLHQFNLPAGTDMSRLLAELGELRKQVREMSRELAELKANLEPTTEERRGRARS